MGLDNGICVKYTQEIDKSKELDKFYQGYHRDFEITYWRKCWNIRNDIFALGIGYDDSFEYDLTKENIEQIIALLQSYNADNWEDGGSCIWDFDDEEWPYSEHIKRNIENLQLLRKLMDKYELEVYFYDSY
jgi:hypothetical protein